ncbi:hypothetical protein AB5J62_31580 [Amycolatopsis sp. cg5]|uniref:hypothetical protein n=1 Tax=Amycolatopsis sp. cg5 TaxID=3238802 RepID=UPI0035244F66
MRKAFTRALVTTAVVASAVAVTPQVAFAGGAHSDCPHALTCGARVSGFPGGTISIDADSGGGGIANWSLQGTNPGNNYSCGTAFDAYAPPKSWLCTGAPPGNYSLRVQGPDAPTMAGIRW